jgi:hypothetical protein
MVAFVAVTAALPSKTKLDVAVDELALFCAWATVLVSLGAFNPVTDGISLELELIAGELVGDIESPHPVKNSANVKRTPVANADEVSPRMGRIGNFFNCQSPCIFGFDEPIPDKCKA